MLQVIFDWDEVTTLIHMLQSEGISYLIGDAPPLSEKLKPIDSVSLIRRLAACNYPLVENASISLFLLHPELAPKVVEALQSSDVEIVENIAIVALATLYLQQWWFFRLTFAFGQLPTFSEELFASFWEERHLPPPSSGYGRDGLLALQDYQQQRYGAPLNFIDDWQNQINHLLAQEEAFQRSLPEPVKDKLKQLSILEG